MPFTEIDQIALPDPGRARVYEHGWQSWSPTGCYGTEATSARPAHGWQQTMRFRPEVPAPDRGFQGEGLLAVCPGEGQGVRLYAARDPRSVVPSIRARLQGSALIVSADGPVDMTNSADDLNQALQDYGEHLAGAMSVSLREAPSVWCSWYQYFLDVGEEDIVENLEAIVDHDLPADVVQVDDGWEAGVGNWLELSERFSDLEGLAARIRDSGRRAGIWLAPFIAGGNSTLAQQHPDWLVGDAGWNWDQPLHGLDLTHPGVREHLRDVFDSLRRKGFDYFKLDFLYGGALPGRRYEDCTGVEAYRAGLELVRAAIGAESYLVGCGAPILPSVGLVDAMRVSPDTYNPTDPDDGSNVLRGQPCIEARAWQHGRLWVNDADCLVARPQFARRTEWAAVIERWGGLRSASDRILNLDRWGLETTRRLLSSTPPPTPFPRLPALCTG